MELSFCTVLALSIPAVFMIGFAIFGATSITAHCKSQSETPKPKTRIRLASYTRKLQPHHVGMAVAICIAVLIGTGASQTEFKNCNEEDTVTRAIKKYAPSKAVEIIAAIPCDCEK